MVDKTKQLARNTAILAFGKIFTQLTGFLLLPLYTAHLSNEEYGLVDLFASYAALIAPVIALRLEIAIFRWLVEARGDEQKTAAVILNALQLVFAAAITFSALFFAINIWADIPYAALLYLYVVSMALQGIAAQIARGLGKTKLFVAANVTTGLSTAAISVILILIFNMRIEGMLIGSIAGFVIGIVFVLLPLKLRRIVKHAYSERALRRNLLRFSIPMIPNSVSWWIVNVSDRTIISSALGVAANGIYAVSNKFANIPHSIFNVFELSWAESAALHIDSKDKDEFFSSVFSAMSTVLASMILGVIATIPLVANIFIAPDFSTAILYMPVLLLGMYFDLLAKMYGAIYIAKKQTKKVLTTTLVSAALNIIVNIALITWFGLWAAAISTVVAYGAMVFYRHFDTKKYVAVKYKRGRFIGFGVLFLLVCLLYYSNIFLLNILNIVFVVFIAVILNWRFLKAGVRGLPGVFATKKKMS
jgi:O-antigen/teichoic acid export membrane protein